MEMESKDITTSGIEKEQVAQINSFRSFWQEEEHWGLSLEACGVKLETETPHSSIDNTEHVYLETILLK